MSALSPSDCCGVSASIVPENIMGGIERDSSGLITKVNVYQMQWVLERNDVVDGGSRSDPRAESLEDAYDLWVDTVFVAAATNVEYIALTLTGNSKAISSTFALDGILTFISYVLITCFATWILSDGKNPVRSRAKLGPLTVLVVCMSIVASFGICIACGLAFNPVVNSVIFVLLGVGVDDALVILEHVDKEYSAGTKPRLRIPNALSKAGASISLTSFTDFAAFMAGATTIIPALRIFCIFAAVAIFIDFAMQLTTFIVFLRWDETRIEEGRVACDCCGLCAKCNCEAPHPSTITAASTALDSSIDGKQVDGTGVEMTDGAVATSDPEAPVVKSCISAVYEDATYQKDTLARRLITKHLPDLILTTPGKIGVLVLTLIIFAIAIVGVINLQLDFQYSWFLPDGSVAKAASDISLEYFTGENLPAFMYTKDIDYYAKRANVVDLCTELADDKYIVDTSLSCWMKAWADVDSNVLATGGYSETDFYSNLDLFLSGTSHSGVGARFNGFVKWDDDAARTKVVATKIFAQFEAASDANENIDSMLSVRAVASDHPELKAMVFSPPFVFWEGLRVVYEETVRNVLVTILVVWAVCIVFLSDIWCATLTTLSVVFVDLCLFGYLYWIGLHMNTITCINLLLALGLTVDYSAHIAHAYMHCDAPTKDERVRMAYEKIGVSVFQGGMTTFCAVLALAFASTYVFTSFFRCFVLIIGFGLYFGIIVLPVMLSVIGPDKVFKDEVNREQVSASPVNEKTSAIENGESGEIPAPSAPPKQL